MGLCSSKSAQPPASAAAAAKKKSKDPTLEESKLADGASASSFDRAFHKDSTVWVFQERTPACWDVYDKEGPIGQPGYYGRAYLAVSKATAQKVVIKRISKRRHGYTAKMMSAYRREIAVLRHMRHPNVIGLVDALEDRDYLYLVMEAALGGELYEHILSLTNYTERDGAALFKQLLGGVHAMHAQNIGHFDLKPSNCVFKARGKGSRLCIIDLGHARFWQATLRERFHANAGTIQYSAPELLKKSYNLAADMWSLGVMLYVMLVGFPPFYSSMDAGVAQNDPAAAERARNRSVKAKIQGGFEPQVRKGYGPWFSSEKGVPQLSAGAMDLISRLLETDVAKRLTVEEALAHPWVQGQGDVSAVTEPIAPLVQAALRKYCALERFQQEVVSLMADLVQDVEIAQLEKSFAAMDTNGDNQVSIDEFREAMRATTRSLDDAALAKLFSAADLDGNGALSYDELLSSLVHLKLTAKEERLWEAFSQLDRDGNGHVTVEELQHVLELEHVADAEDMIKRVDTGKDGRIDYDEFLAVWRSEHTNKF